MASISESMDQIIYVGIGLFVLVLILSIDYNGYGISASQQLQTSGYTITQQGTQNSLASVNMVAANTLSIVAFNGMTSWIGAGNPLTVTVTGLSIATYATGGGVTAQAIPGASNTLTFQVTSTSAPVTLTASSQFYSINTITLSGFAGTSGASPDVGVTLQQASNTLAGTPTITANEIANVLLGTSYGAYSNFSTYGNNSINAFGGAIQLAVFALVFIAVILAVVGALKGGSGGGSGGFLGR